MSPPSGDHIIGFSSSLSSQPATIGNCASTETVGRSRRPIRKFNHGYYKQKLGRDGKPAINKTMFQAFEWNCPPDHQHWKRLTRIMPSLVELGVTHIWIPPACKATSPQSNGYDIYDLYDLGEFDQKGSRATKWGTLEELQEMVATAAKHGVGVLFDVVFNHKAAADGTEMVMVRQVDDEDRRITISEPFEIEAWTKYEFLGRFAAGKSQGYQGMKWNASHFNGTGYDHKTRKNGIYKFETKSWAQDVDEERGNYDFLMFNNIDHNNPQVLTDLYTWPQWLRERVRAIGGYRLDAVKHYSKAFLRGWIAQAASTASMPDGPAFIVGEYWHADSAVLANYIEYMRYGMSLFDVKLCHNFSRASLEDAPDLSTVFDDSLVAFCPDHAVTFVVNHDTQPGQSLETLVRPFFKPIAYALILLRANAGIPCVFYGDLFGNFGPSPFAYPLPDATSSNPAKFPNDQNGNRFSYTPPIAGGVTLSRLMLARRWWAYGDQHDYFGDGKRSYSCVGFTREGHPAHGKGNGLAVVCNAEKITNSINMYVGKDHIGEKWIDWLGLTPGAVCIDVSGHGCFVAVSKCASVWVNSEVVKSYEIEALAHIDTDIYGLAHSRRAEFACQAK